MNAAPTPALDTGELRKLAGKADAAVEALANSSIGMTLIEWNAVSNELLSAAKALRAAADALDTERGRADSACKTAEREMLTREAAEASLAAAREEIGKKDAALRAAKLDMWVTARHEWTMSDFKNWAVVQQIDAALGGLPR